MRRTMSRVSNSPPLLLRESDACMIRSRRCRSCNEPSNGCPLVFCKSNDELAFLVLSFRRRGDAGHLIVCQTGQFFLAIDHHRRRILFLQHVLLELRL